MKCRRFVQTATERKVLGMRFNKARPGQGGAINTIIDRLMDGQMSTSIILPTGYGKSDVIRACAIHLRQTKAVCCSLIIVPNDYLRGQIVKSDDVLTTAIRFGLPADFKYRAINTLGVDYAANGESFLSTTIQLIQNHTRHFADWIESMVYRTDLPVAVFVDEVHTHTTMNEWGQTIAALQKAGAYIVVLTATPYREDGAQIVGFRVQQTENHLVRITKVRPSETPEKVLVQIWGGCEYHYTLEADYTHSFHDAWGESVLCHVSRHEFDAEVSIIDPEGILDVPHTRLSDLNESDVRRVLGKAVRHPDVIRKGCEIFVGRLRETRRANPAVYDDCAGIIFTANDENQERNEHAEQIKAVIKQLDPSLKVIIATSADDDNGKKTGRTLLENFVNNGDGDVVIVKQMAGLGLDAPRIKVCLDLSPIRSPIAFIQRINRATRPYKGMMIAHLVTLADILQRGCFEEFIDSQGGAIGRDLELIKQYEKDKEEGPPLPLFMVHGAEVGDLGDTKHNIAIRDELPLILAVLEKWPILITVRSFPEIAADARELFPQGIPSLPPRPVNTGVQLEDLRAECNTKAGDLKKLRFIKKMGRAYHGSREDSSVWGSIRVMYGMKPSGAPG